MSFILLFSYIFLSQFPSIIKIGSSYLGLHIFLLPFLYLYVLKIRKIIIYLLPILFLSTLIGFINFSQFNKIEIILRIVGILTLLVSLIMPINFYNKINNFYVFKNKYLNKILLFSLPNLIFCFFEFVYRFSSNGALYSFLVEIKNIIFVRGRATQVVGSISGLFPEHGLFAPFLLFILGISFLFINKIKQNYSFLISFLWIFFTFFHSSGLFIASISLSLLIYLIIFSISLIIKLSVSKNSLKYVFLFIFLISAIILISPYTHNFLYNRFLNIFKTSVQYDKSLAYKLLPYYVILKSSLTDLFIGSGLGNYTELVTEKLNDLPTFLIYNKYFLGNLSNERFPLNSTIICSVLEYGLILWILIFFNLQKFIKLFKPIKLFINFKNTLSMGFKLNEVLAICFLMSSFLSIFGPVPLTYPFPYLSLSLILILFDAKEKGFNIS